MTVKRTIIFAHLLNDYSGSPRVLRNMLAELREQYDCRLYVGSSGPGILSGTGVPITAYWYRRSRRRMLTLLAYLISQLHLFIKLLLSRDGKRCDLVYVNTLLPFGAALYGALAGKKVVYHIHEISVTPPFLRRFLVQVARMTASLVIYVSTEHQRALPVAKVPSAVVLNTLDRRFLEQAVAYAYRPRYGWMFNVLMVSSLRRYKGVPEFIALASVLEGERGMKFHLVANDSAETVEDYLRANLAPSNLVVHPRTPDMEAYYGMASVLVNLSRTDLWIETFGMTILEAMAYGIPVIVPPVGGPCELVADGVQGFLVDSRNGKLLSERVMQLFSDPQLCERMSRAGRKRAAEFNPEVYSEKIANILDKARNGIA